MRCNMNRKNNVIEFNIANIVSDNDMRALFDWG